MPTDNHQQIHTHIQVHETDNEHRCSRKKNVKIQNKSNDTFSAFGCTFTCIEFRKWK